MVSVFSSLRQSFKGLLVLVPVLIGLAFISPAEAVQWDAETLTVPVNPDGAEVTFTDREINAGRKVFNTSCGTCHAGGITKTNQNVGLDPETLALATPARDNVDALVDYMKDPTSYDGEYSIPTSTPACVVLSCTRQCAISMTKICASWLVTSSCPRKSKDRLGVAARFTSKE